MYVNVGQRTKRGRGLKMNKKKEGSQKRMEGTRRDMKLFHWARKEYKQKEKGKKEGWRGDLGGLMKDEGE